jgi:hypothetical protein
MPLLQLYRNVGNALAGSLVSGNAPIDWLSDTIKCMLCTSTYTPNLDTHKYKSDITNEITGTGYSAGGATLGSAAITFTAANSWATQWAASTAFVVGDIVRPTTGNGHLYMCIVAGTSGGSAPTWPTVARQTVADNTVTWAEIGGGINQFDAADASWSSATLTARYAVVYDSTPSTDATRPLIGLLDFGSDVSSTASTYTVVWDSRGLFAIPVA